MGWKENVADYLRFTRKDRVAITTIVLLIIVIFFLPQLIPHPAGGEASIHTDTTWINAMKQLEKPAGADYGKPDDDNMPAYQYDRPARKIYTYPRRELFAFDPNTLSEAGWKKLGLREKTIATILNYVNKGGRFRQPDDLRRIYGLFPDEYERLAPYVRIAGDPHAGPAKYPVNTERPVPPKKETRVMTVDINSADTSAFIALPGIGSKLAGRIVSFREKLGGFYTVEQIGETFGLADSTFQKIKPWLRLENTVVRKININTASLEELKAHPYIRYQLANPIIAYRKEHGLFLKPDDIKKIMAITTEIYDRIQHYLSIE